MTQLGNGFKRNKEYSFNKSKKLYKIIEVKTNKTIYKTNSYKDMLDHFDNVL